MLSTLPRKRILAVTIVLLAIPLLAAAFVQADGVPQVPCSDLRGCPDLTADAATMQPKLQTKTFKAQDCNVVEGSTQAGTRTLLRFTFTTPNLGPGDLVVGDPSAHPEWFEYSACHGHYHFKLYAEYRLWTPSNYAAWNQLRTANPDLTADQVLAAHPELTFVTSHKQGFCVIDVVQYQLTAAPKYLVCNYQGISVGWADEYSTSLDGQYVDVTGLPHGSYVLEEEVNAHRLYEETNYGNNRAAVTVTI